jgi:phosphatidylserine decarboxylase
VSAVISALRLVPKNAFSRAVGAMLRAPWPKPMVRLGIQGFSKAYGVETDEAERDVLSYRTFNEFFTRRLKPGLRPIAEGSSLACSPVDGTVGQVGTIRDGTLIQAKGREYTLADFLVDELDTRDYEGGTFATLYLAPYNYHRIHVPLSGEITGYTYVPGHLWPVNAKGIAEIDRLFAVNERLITHMSTAAGKVAIAKVGATCVGRIRATYDDVVTNNGPAAYRRTRYEQPIEARKGDECGIFEMGSTVIVLFQKNRVELDSSIELGASIRLGQPLASLPAGR